MRSLTRLSALVISSWRQHTTTYASDKLLTSITFIHCRYQSTMVAPAHTPGGMTAAPKFECLPDFVKPTRYTLRLKPDLTTFTTEGEVSIDVTLEKAVKQIRMHSKETEILEANVNGKPLQVELSEAMESVLLTSAEELAPGNVTVALKFKSLLNDKMHGFYRSTYTCSETGETRYIASTQFEVCLLQREPMWKYFILKSTYARLAFPCFDEPLFKAVFDVTLIVKEGLDALSNMNEVARTPAGNGWTAVSFAPTPVMSSYLVAFVVGNFSCIEAKTKNNTVVRVYAVNKKHEQGRFSLECATRALDYYDEFFGIKYPLPKCDLIAIPDFSMGAMENWGLVTYREVCLLCEEGKTSALQRVRVALVVAHELAHMWFGNLVTMRWWTDLWLKEGFATFMEYLFVSVGYPEFKIWMRFANDEVVRGLTLDGLASSHPIEVEIGNPNEIEDIYDGVSYSKGASVNGMVYAYLGHDRFREALRAYLKNFQYSNAVTKDLWQAMSDASGEDIAAHMKSWTSQMGYPVVSVKYDKATKKLQLSQRRFLADGSIDKSNPLWHIPITICSASSPNEIVTKVMMTEAEEEFSLADCNGIAPGDWIKLNAGLKGFYRVVYDDATMAPLLPAIESRQLAAIDRFNLLADLFALIRASQADASTFLELVSRCREDDELLVWEEIDSAIGTLINVLRRADPKLEAGLHKFVRTVYEPLMNKLTCDAKPGEAQQQSILRARIINRLGHCEHTPTIERARELFTAHVAGRADVHPDQRRAIYSINAATGGETAFEQLMQLHESSESPEIKRTAILTLGATRDAALLQRALEFVIDSGKVRSQDIVYVFAGIASTLEGQNFIWPAFKQEMNKLLEKFGGANSTLFQHCLQYSCEMHSDMAIANDVEAFVKASPHAKTLDRTMRQAIEAIRINAAMLERQKANVGTFLDSGKF